VAGIAPITLQRTRDEGAIVVDRDARNIRGERPVVFANIRAGQGVEDVVTFITKFGGLP
jgi:Ni2+-binding GTPase involved in maturation of urease and hydrogenase